MENLPQSLPTYIPFFSDYGFKVTFGNEKKTLFLRKALQALINSTIPIEEVWFEKNTIEGATEESRGGVLDLSCRDERGNVFIVEMQWGYMRHIIQRLKFYEAARMNIHIRKGNLTFNGLPKIYCIAILGYSLFPDPNYHRIGQMRDENGVIMDECTTFPVVELEKFNKKPEDCITDLDKLVYTMKEAHLLEKSGEQKPDFMEEPWLKSALEELDTRGLDPERHAQLSIALAREMSERWRLQNLENELTKRGMEIGKEIGKEMGVEIGKEMGGNEREKEIIRNYIKSKPNATNEEIITLLGVSLPIVLEVRAEQADAGQ